MSGSAEALERFEHRTAWLMLLLSLGILPLLIIPMVTELSPATQTTFYALDWIIWAAFVIEYAIRVYLAPAKGHFVKTHVIDLIIVVAPFLRPLRVARSARALRLLRLGGVVVFFLRGVEAGKEILTRHKLHYTLLVAMLVTVVGGMVVLVFESASDTANIRSLFDALWWAVATVTTVGYGDRYPTTVAGRVVAVVLMLVGVGLFGLLAASLASFLIERDQEHVPDPHHDELVERLDRIEQRLAQVQISEDGEGMASSPTLGEADKTPRKPMP